MWLKSQHNPRNGEGEEIARSAHRNRPGLSKLVDIVLLQGQFSRSLVQTTSTRPVLISSLTSAA